MWITVAMQVFKIMAPIVLDMVAKHHASTGSMPTEEELLKQFNANINEALSEGDEWLRKHPKE